MIMRLFLIGGAVFITAVWVLTVTFSPTPYQGFAATMVEKYRAQGLMPAPGELAMSESIEHGVFEVPASDADQAAANARTVPVKMHEWGFSPGSLKVKLGEVIRFTVTNTGNVLHEFMFMPPAAMNAVRYRLQRADWNLLEHEAPFEKSMIMPGDKFEVVFKIEKPDVWMFMCMFPYHMQLGMMGSMSTGGMAMNMGGMNM